MYEKVLKVNKGVDNVVQFVFKNSDNKPVNVTGWTITFNMFSDSALILSKTVTIVNAVGGTATLLLSELDLFGMDHRSYQYSVTVTNSLGSEQVVYTSEEYGVRGSILVNDGPYPALSPSIVVSLPTTSNSTVITSSVTADTTSRQLSAHHTAQFYFSNFTGNLTIQGTLDPLPTNGNVGLSWGTISTLPYLNQKSTDYYNFDGVYTAVRFLIAPTSGNVSPSPVTQILYRA